MRTVKHKGSKDLRFIFLISMLGGSFFMESSKKSSYDKILINS